MDGTPILDIKPYIPAYDSFPDERGGWLAEMEESLREPGVYQIRYLPLAETQAAWLLAGWGIDFRPRMVEILSRDPTQHRSRRIRRYGDHQLVIGCGAWRAIYSCQEKEVRVEYIEPAYPARFLNDPEREGVPDRAAQLAFLEHWPERPR